MKAGTLLRRPPDERLAYTVEEVAVLLGIGRNQAYDAVGRGDIPSVRIGKLIRVPRVALEAWLAARPTLPEERG